jgi:hypothetical protein
MVWYRTYILAIGAGRLVAQKGKKNQRAEKNDIEL